jgi:hypothetical protein
VNAANPRKKNLATPAVRPAIWLVNVLKPTLALEEDGALEAAADLVVVKNATNAAKSDISLATAIKLADTATNPMVAGMAEAVAAVVVSLVTLAEASAICLAIAPRVKSATTVSSYPIQHQGKDTYHFSRW